MPLRFLTVKQIHKKILQGKLKWIKNVDGLSPLEIRIIYTAQAQSHENGFSEHELNECLNEEEKPLGGM